MADDRTPLHLPDAAHATRAAPARPSRATSILVGLAMICLLVFVGFLRKPTKREAPFAAPAAPIASTVPANPPANPADQLASAMAELEKLPLSNGPPLAKIYEALEGAGVSDKGYKLPDGRDPPPLGEGTPRAVRIGVVLIRYRGAQLAPLDAPTLETAMVRAKKLSELAKTDFAAAVKAGDLGSALDIGAVQRSILEPGTQYVVFTMAPGSISDILDTPRGLWIVRRIR